MSSTLIYNAARDPVHTSQLSAAWISPLYPGEATKGLIFKFALSSSNQTHANINVCRMVRTTLCCGVQFFSGCLASCQAS